ncbi:class I SAM-dependent methyltransferase [Methyloversatilis thermotolerans]|uniref:class I SAM-dependent methyltransferase n=1 Tax=Methyloversatilis thermotolerans TaxID=1346290 RepID=UPI00035D3568|nr:class I SAM-dependent methyltransferase [Methyloversatilis thermotolerans]
MHLLRALGIQLVSWIVALFALRYTITPPAGLGSVVIMQAGIAGAFALAMRAPRWWVMIHLLFSPLIVITRTLAIAPAWYLAAFVALAAVFWSTFRSRVPLFLTNQATARSLLQALPQDRAIHLVDLGCGTGGLLRRLALSRPDCTFTGVENAPLPWLVARWTNRGLPNVTIRRQDLWAVDLGDFDVIYAFLSPVPMPRLGRKAAIEMRPQALFISNSFTIPGMRADRVIDNDPAARPLHVYGFAARRGKNGRTVVEPEAELRADSTALSGDGHGLIAE